MSPLYNRLSVFYDLLFSSSLDDARKRAIDALQIQESTKVIEFGVGTGLSLYHFPKSFTGFTGIDISEKMLQKFAARADDLQMNVNIQLMDCEHTTFESETFDYVILMYVYSVTKDPHQIIKEAFRLCKNTGTVVIVNHFSEVKNSKPNVVEYLLSYFESFIGFKSKFPFKEYITDKNLVIKAMFSANLFSVTKVILLEKCNNLHLV
ncbi:MAG: class I SAM-dependent methyltransferase [Chitinophagia bacterium]|jgi:phosphatidylethanolamine/phosphatidyl-N-methylethanolamine N-methyltransferase